MLGIMWNGKIKHIFIDIMIMKINKSNMENDMFNC